MPGRSARLPATPGRPRPCGRAAPSRAGQASRGGRASGNGAWVRKFVSLNVSRFCMSHIHFPLECANDPVIGPLMPPTNEKQNETYIAALLAEQQYAEKMYMRFDAVRAHVGHNLAVAGRKFMPFSEIAGPEAVMEPYSKWQGYEHLVIVKDDGEISWCAYIFMPSNQLSEGQLMDCLLLFRRYLVQAVHPLDKVALDAAIAECIHQIDKQRKRCETAR